MSFEERRPGGGNKSPDIKIKTRHKTAEGAKHVPLLVAWYDDPSAKSVRFQVSREHAAILPIPKGDFLTKVEERAKGGDGLAQFILDNLFTAGRTGSHHCDMYLDFLEGWTPPKEEEGNGQVAAPTPTQSSEFDDDDDDFSWA